MPGNNNNNPPGGPPNTETDYRQAEIDRAEAKVLRAEQKQKEARTHSEYLERELELNQEIFDLIVLMGKKHDESDEHYKKRTQLLNNHIELLKRSAEVQSKLTDSSKGWLLNTLGIEDKFNTGIIRGLRDIWNVSDKTGDKFKEMGKAVDSITHGLLEAVHPANIIGGAFSYILESTIKAVTAFDSAQASLSGITGQGNKYNHMIKSIADGNRQFGISFGEAGKAAEAMFTSLPSFTDSKVQHDITQAAARWNELGVSFEDTAGNMNYLQKSLGYSGPKALKTIDDLLLKALDLQVPPSVMMAEFKQSQEYLAAWGTKSIPIFNKLKATYKALGIEMQSLVNVSKKFDTFTGAAETAGRLNMLMGRDLLNPLAMAAMDPNQKLTAISQAFNEAGLRFGDSMNFKLKEAFAEQLGLTVAELEAFGKGGVSALKKAQQKAAKSKISDKARLLGAIRSSTTMGEKLNGVVESLAIATVALNETMHKVLNILLDPERRQELFGKATGGLGLLSGMMTASFLLPFIKMLPAVAAKKGGPVGLGIAAAVTVGVAVASKLGMDSLLSSGAVDKKAKLQAENQQRIANAIEKAISEGKKVEKIKRGGEVINVYVDGKPLFKIMNERQANEDVHQAASSLSSDIGQAVEKLGSASYADARRIVTGGKGMGR